MKKLIIGMLSLGLVFGVGSAVYASTDGFSSFEEMLPFMQKMHPDWSDEELEDMYRSCHGEGGPAQGRGMMGSYNSDTRIVD